MAVMNAAGRLQAFRDWLDEIRQVGLPFNLSKSDAQATIDAADTFVSDNAAAFNSALPVVARNTLTTSEKAMLFMIVVARRFKVGA